MKIKPVRRKLVEQLKILENQLVKLDLVAYSQEKYFKYYYDNKIKIDRLNLTFKQTNTMILIFLENQIFNNEEDFYKVVKLRRKKHYLIKEVKFLDKKFKENIARIDEKLKKLRACNFSNLKIIGFFSLKFNKEKHIENYKFLKDLLKDFTEYENHLSEFLEKPRKSFENYNINNNDQNNNYKKNNKQTKVVKKNNKSNNNNKKANKSNKIQKNNNITKTEKNKDTNKSKNTKDEKDKKNTKNTKNLKNKKDVKNTKEFNKNNQKKNINKSNNNSKKTNQTKKITNNNNNNKK